MIRILFGSIILLLVASSCSHDVVFEDEIYSMVQAEYLKDEIDIQQKLDSTEMLLVEGGVLEDTSWVSRKKYLQFVAKHDTFPQVNSDSILFELLNSSLDFRVLDRTIDLIGDTKNFKSSNFNKILTKLEAYDTDKRTQAKVIANSILTQLKDEDYKHPFYESLILTLAVDAHRDLFETRDVIDTVPLPAETPWFCDLGWELNFHIKFNEMNEFMFRGKRPNNITDLENMVYRYYSINKHLSKEETKNAVSNPKYEGYGNPFYYYLQKDEIIKQYESAKHDLIKSYSLEDIPEDFIDFKRQVVLKWNSKLTLFHYLKDDFLKELHSQSHIEIVWKEKARNKYQEIVYKMILATIDKLREEDAEKHLEESYETIKDRNCIFRNDHQKLRFLEMLTPLVVLENPYNLMDEALDPIEVTEPPE